MQDASDFTDPDAELTVCVPPAEDLGKLVTLLSGAGPVNVTQDNVGEIILTHIAEGRADLMNLLDAPNGTIIPSLAGYNLTLTSNDTNFFLTAGVNTVTVAMADIDACAEGCGPAFTGPSSGGSSAETKRLRMTGPHIAQARPPLVVTATGWSRR